MCFADLELWAFWKVSMVLLPVSFIFSRVFESVSQRGTQRQPIRDWSIAAQTNLIPKPRNLNAEQRYYFPKILELEHKCLFGICDNFSTPAVRLFKYSIRRNKMDNEKSECWNVGRFAKCFTIFCKMWNNLSRLLVSASSDTIRLVSEWATKWTARKVNDFLLETYWFS